jgi:hypothetical protein
MHQAADLKRFDSERFLEEPNMGPHALKKTMAWIEQVLEYQRQTANGNTLTVPAAPAQEPKDEPHAPRTASTVESKEYSKMANAAAKVGQALFVEVIEEKEGAPDELGLVSVDPNTVSHIERGRHGDDPMIHWDTSSGAQAAKVRHPMDQIYHILLIARKNGKGK